MNIKAIALKMAMACNAIAFAAGTGLLAPGAAFALGYGKYARESSTATFIDENIAVELSEGEHTVRTVNLTPGSDTVLHVFQISGALCQVNDSSYEQIAGNDDCEGTLDKSSCVTFTLDQPRYVWIVVHSFDEKTGGFAQVAIDDNLPYIAQEFGGYRVSISAWRANTMFQMLKTPEHISGFRAMVVTGDDVSKALGVVTTCQSLGDAPSLRDPLACGVHTEREYCKHS